MRCGMVIPRPQLPPQLYAASPNPQCHCAARHGKAVTGKDPRARRPTVDSVARRAGCLGDGRDSLRIGTPLMHPDRGQRVLRRSGRRHPRGWMPLQGGCG
jgi:hypothetical protein